MAEVLGELMVDVLGYGRFGAQGGDWGAGVVSRLAYQRASAMTGIHLNLLFSRPGVPPGQEPTPEEAETLAQMDRWLKEGTGYQWIQGTQTVAYALTDSPVGLAAWIVEKFRAWSDCGGQVESRFTKDELLTNITIYWVTETINSSIRLYADNRLQPPGFKEGERITVPCGIALTREKIDQVPREWAERSYNVQRWTEFPRGGHFAAMEEPELLVEDIREFFRPLRSQ
jgi:microsomal epoxide hydrolase